MTSDRSVILPEARGILELRSSQTGGPGPGDVLRGWRLGHEGIGTVEAVGEQVTGWQPGDRAGITFLGPTWGRWDSSLAGRERFCRRQPNSATRSRTRSA